MRNSYILFLIFYTFSQFAWGQKTSITLGQDEYNKMVIDLNTQKEKHNELQSKLNQEQQKYLEANKQFEMQLNRLRTDSLSMASQVQSLQNRIGVLEQQQSTLKKQQNDTQNELNESNKAKAQVAQLEADVKRLTNVILEKNAELSKVEALQLNLSKAIKEVELGKNNQKQLESVISQKQQELKECKDRIDKGNIAAILEENTAYKSDIQKKIKIDVENFIQTGNIKSSLDGDFESLTKRIKELKRFNTTPELEKISADLIFFQNIYREYNESMQILNQQYNKESIQSKISLLDSYMNRISNQTSNYELQKLKSLLVGYCEKTNDVYYSLKIINGVTLPQSKVKEINKIKPTISDYPFLLGEINKKASNFNYKSPVSQAEECN